MRDALAALEAALGGLDWYLFGAQAALLYGSTRLTADIDVTAWVPDRDALVDRLREHGISVRESAPDFIAQTRVLAVTHDATGWEMDIVFGAPGLEEQVLSRAKLVDIEGLRIRVASPEDIVVLKCLAGRDTDREDVVAILTAQHDRIDLGYVEGLIALLRDALAEDEIARFFESARAASQRALARSRKE
jgi:hypothetical protein